MLALYNELHELGQATGDAWSNTYAAIGLGNRAVLLSDDISGRDLLERALTLAVRLAHQPSATSISTSLSQDKAEAAERTARGIVVLAATCHPSLGCSRFESIHFPLGRRRLSLRLRATPTGAASGYGSRS